MPTAKYRLYPLLCLLAALLCCACQRGPDSVPSIPAESRLVIAKPGDPVGLDPANVTDLESLQICRNIFDTLVAFKPNSTEIEAALAESWDLAEDGLSITFQLRPGVLFHDGTPLTAEAVRANYQRQADPKDPLRNPGDTFFYWNDTWGDRMKSIDVLGPLTLRFRFSEPIAPLMQNFAMPFFGISSPQALEKHGNDYFRHPVGTGPYKFEKWLPGERLSLLANETYWGGKVQVERVDFVPVPDSTGRELQLRKGAVHVATALSPQGVERLLEGQSVRVIDQPGLNVAFLALNNQLASLKDLRVRKAIWHAVDREALLRALYYGLADVTDTALPQGVWGRQESGGRAFDPEQGRKLMEQAGYSSEKPLALKFWYMAVPRSYMPEPKATAEAISRMLEEVYIECDLEPVDWGVYLDRVGKGEHELALAGWIGDHGDPDNYLGFIFGSTNIDTVVGGTNVLLYSNPRVDELITGARRELDQQKRVAFYQDAQHQIFSDAPWLPLAHARQVAGVHPRLEGLVLHPTGVLLLHEIRWNRDESES